MCPVVFAEQQALTEPSRGHKGDVLLTSTRDGARQLHGRSQYGRLPRELDTPVDHKNDFGGTFGGPVRIPHLYNGHDKTFGFFAWSKSNLPPAHDYHHRPSCRGLGGDFSNRLTHISRMTL